MPEPDPEEPDPEPEPEEPDPEPEPEALDPSDNRKFSDRSLEILDAAGASRNLGHPTPGLFVQDEPPSLNIMFSRQ